MTPTLPYHLPDLIVPAFSSGKPTRPNGPLVVDDVYDKGAILKWKKPDDDGGMPIKEYVIEKMDMDTGQCIPKHLFASLFVRHSFARPSRLKCHLTQTCIYI